MTDFPDGGTVVENPGPTEAFPYFLYLCTSLNPWADLNMVRAMRETPRWLQGQPAKCFEST